MNEEINNSLSLNKEKKDTLSIKVDTFISDINKNLDDDVFKDLDMFISNIIKNIDEASKKTDIFEKEIEIFNINEDYYYIDKTLIIYQFHLEKQWKSECSKLSINYKKITGNLQKNKDIYEEKYEGVILCRNTMIQYLDFNISNKKVIFKRIVVDDSHDIKINNKFIDNINNSGYYYWHLSHSLRNNSSVWEKNIKNNIYTKDKDIDLYFEIKDYKLEYVTCYSKEHNVIKKYLNNKQIKMLNADCVELIIDNLNCEKITKDNLILTFTQKTDEEIIKLKEKLNNVKQEKNSNLVNEINNKILSLKERLYNISKDIKNLNSNECIICQSDIKNAMIVRCCNNMLCSYCILNWIKNSPSCPFCREIIDINKSDSVLIIYHKLDIKMLNQVLGRAMRLNRKKPLDVFQLKYNNE
jgi:hypothetical protein